MQLASRSPLLRTSCCWLGNLLQGLRGHSLQSALRLSPTLSQNFRENSSIRRPQPSAGAHQRKSKHQGPWCLALAKPHFWKLGCWIWSLSLETSESNVRQYQRPVQGGASGPWYLAHLRKLGCYLWCGAILLPDPGRQEVVALNKLQCIQW